jgi:tetratricopeptide (TPR) repeat protein
MSASSTEPRPAAAVAARRPALALAVLALLATSAAPWPAWAQDDPGAPTPLFPGSGGIAEPAPRPAADPGADPGARAPLDEPRAPAGTEVERLDEPAPRAPQGISVDALEPIDPATVGVLTERDPGGFPGEVWQGLDRRQVANLIAGIPADLSSPILRDLIRRLLLTSAAPPAGPPRSEGPTILGLRAERLFELGDTAALIRLLEVAPEGSGDEPLDRTRVQARLITGERQEACRLARHGVAEYGGNWWSKALVFCQLAAGEEDAAMLGLDLLRERVGGDLDQDFLSLASALMGMGAAPRRPEPTPLNLAMLAKLQARPDSALLTDVPLGRVEQVLGLQALPAGERVALAERAAAAGVLPGVRLADFYDTFAFDDAELAGAAGAALDPAQVRDRALLFRALQRAVAPPEKAELLRHYLAGTRAAGVPLAGVQAALPQAVELSPQPGLARWSAAPGRILFYDRRLEQAVEWVENARAAAGQWPEAAGAVRLLWPYARLSGAPVAGWASLADWAADAQRAGVDAQTVGLLAAGLYGLGERDAVGQAGLTAETGPPPETPQLEAMRAAAAAGRTGEALLRATAVVGARGAAGLHPLTLAVVVEALSSLGLQAEAREFAMEALVSRGL